MIAENTLQRDDIVGKRIKNIYQSLPDVDPDGYSGCSAYVELEDGTAFELQSPAFEEAHPVVRVDLKRIDANPVAESGLRTCIGETILEVLACRRWPGMGLHVSNNYLIYYYANPSAGAWHVGPFASPVGDPFKLSDTVAYWQQSR